MGQRIRTSHGAEVGAPSAWIMRIEAESQPEDAEPSRTSPVPVTRAAALCRAAPARRSGSEHLTEGYGAGWCD